MAPLNRIQPKAGMPVYATIPPAASIDLRFPLLVRTLCPPIFKLIRIAHDAVRGRRHLRVQELLDRVWQCDTRADVEQLLGLPIYQLTGDVYQVKDAEGRAWRPEIVEVYKARSATIWFVFRGGFLFEVGWWLDRGPWDTVPPEKSIREAKIGVGKAD